MDDGDNTALSEDEQELSKQALISSWYKDIYDAEIKKEKAEQEKIKTLELKKDLAPMYMIKHFFGFAENMIQRSYTRMHEIIPELSALIQAGKMKEAEQLLIKEQETIVHEARTEMVKAIEDEGYKAKK